MDAMTTDSSEEIIDMTPRGPEEGPERTLTIPDELSLLPLRGTVLFPLVVQPHFLLYRVHILD